MSTLEFQSSTADASVSASTAPVDATITTASLTISTTSSSSSDAAITVDNCVIVNDTTKPLSLSLLTHLSPSSNESHKLLPFVSSASLSTPGSSDDTEDGNDMNESVSSHIDLNPTDCSTPNSVDDNSAKKRSRDVEYGADHPYFFTSITNEDKQKQLRKKGPWTQSEDDLLRSLVAKYGPRKWSVIALYVEGRIGKQCRERWMNHLDESLLKTSWTEEEDNLLLKIQKTIGNRWSEMTKYFVGRSENSIKNRWYSVSKPPSRTTLSKTPKEAVSPKLPLLQCEEVKQLSVNEMIDTKSMEELVELARRQPKRQRKSASDIPIDFNLLSSSTAAVSSSSPSPQIHKSMLPLRQVSSEPQLLFEQQQQQLNHKLMIDAQMQKMHYQAMQHALSHSPSHTNVQSFNSRSNLPIHMTNAQPMSELCFDPNTYARFSSAKQMHPYQPFNGFIQNNLIQAPQSFPNQFVYPADMNLQGFGLSKVVSPYAHPQAANMHPVNNVMYNM